MHVELPIAFAAETEEPPALEIRVNFGIVAGREATPAEIDELARTLLAVVEDVEIVSEQHYEVGREHEATVHQVRVRISRDALADDGARDALTQQLVDAAGRWAEACAAERHTEV
jgi:hypothetical protein